MSDTLVVRLPAADDQPFEWVTVDALGIGEPLSGVLAEALPWAENRNIIALAPANQVLRLSAEIPLKGTAKIRQALPFALEELIAGDIDSQHFAFSRKGDDGKLPVAVADKALVSHWLTELRESGLNPTAVYAESDAVETTPATLTILLDKQQAIIRDDFGEINVADEGSLQTILELLLDQQTLLLENDATMVPLNLRVFCSETMHEQYADLWDRLRLRAETLDVSILPDGAMPLLAGQITSQPGINLLQGEFAPKTQMPVKWENWRLAASLAGAFLVITLCLQGVRMWQLNSADTALDTAATQILQQTFPEAGDSSDPWNELRSRLGASDEAEIAEGIRFGEAVEAVSSAFAQTPEITMQAMSFRSGVLDLQLIAPNVAALDQLRKLIGQDGRFSADIQSANPADDVIKGRMQIMAAGDS